MSIKRVVLVAKLLALLLFSVDCQGPPAGPPEVNEPGGDDCSLIMGPKVMVCPDDVSQAFANTDGVQTLRLNETTAFVTGEIVFSQGLNEQTMVDIECFKEANGKMEMVFSHRICDLCTELGNEESDYYKYLMYFGLPDKCPFEAGAYKIHDLLADTADLPINNANMGRYETKMCLYNYEERKPGASCCDEKTLLACFTFDFEIECYV